MTWIDWATVACVVYAVLLSTLVAIRQQLRIRGDRELLRYQQRPRVKVDRVDLLKPDLVAPVAGSGIEAGDPVYWDGSLPGRVTTTSSGNDQAGHLLSDKPLRRPNRTKPLSDRDAHLAAVFGVAPSDSQPVEPGMVKP